MISYYTAFSYDEPIVIQPGDDIQTTCVYRSEDRTEMVYFGDGTQEEMCFAFLLYYPKENAASASKLINLFFCFGRKQTLVKVAFQFVCIFIDIYTTLN